MNLILPHLERISPEELKKIRQKTLVWYAKIESAV
jgi:hypothetical protein